MKAIIDYAVQAASADMTWKAIDRYSKDYVELQTKDKVKFYKTPDAILQKQLEIFDSVMDKRKDNALFEEIIDSQKEFAERAVAGTSTTTSTGAWRTTTTSDRQAHQPRRPDLAQDQPSCAGRVLFFSARRRACACFSRGDRPAAGGSGDARTLAAVRRQGERPSSARRFPG